MFAGLRRCRSPFLFVEMKGKRFELRSKAHLSAMRLSEDGGPKF